MTNVEYERLVAEVGDLTVIVMRQCGTDKSKIDDGLWERLVRLYRQVEEYVG